MMKLTSTTLSLVTLLSESPSTISGIKLKLKKAQKHRLSSVDEAYLKGRCQDAAKVDRKDKEYLGRFFDQYQKLIRTLATETTKKSFRCLGKHLRLKPSH